MGSPRHILFGSAIGVCALGVSPLVRAAAQPEAPGPISALDPVFVEVSKGVPWHYITLPGFEVLSHCPDTFNEGFARALERSTEARLALLPDAFWGDLPTPMKFILYNRAPAPREGIEAGSPIDLSWSSAGSGFSGSDSLQVSHPITVGDGDAYVNCGNYWDLIHDSSDLSIDPDGAIRMRNRVPRLPGWFQEGAYGERGLFAFRVIRPSLAGDVVVLPNAFWVSPADTAALQQEAANPSKERRARPRVMLPLAGLLTGSGRAGNEDLWNCQASLFVRWGLFGSGRRDAFLEFADLASREPADEALFRRCFGFGFDEASLQLAAYLPRATLENLRVPLPRLHDRPLDDRDARPHEVARIVGEWGRLASTSVGSRYSEYRSDCLEQASQVLERIYLRGNRDPLFLATYGLYAAQVEDAPRAREALEMAARLEVVRPRAYLELARLRLEAALPSVQQGIGDLTPKEFDGIRDMIDVARTQMPSLESCYRLLERLFEHAPAVPARADLAVLDNAVRMFPQDAGLAAKVAFLYRRLGYTDDAVSVARRAARFAESDEDRARLASVSFASRK